MLGVWVRPRTRPVSVVEEDVGWAVSEVWWGDCGGGAGGGHVNQYFYLMNNTYNDTLLYTSSTTSTFLDSPIVPQLFHPTIIPMSSSSPNCLFFCNDNVLSPKGIVLLFFAVFLGMFVVHFVPQHIPHIVLGLFVLSTLCILIVDYMRRNQLGDVTQARPTTFAQSLVLTNYTLIALFYVGSLLGGYMYRRVAGWAVWVVLAVCVVGVILMGFPNRALEWGGRSVNRERFYGGGLMELDDYFTPTPTPLLTHVPKVGNVEDSSTKTPAPQPS